MKKFVAHIFIIVCIVVVSAYFLDYSYTYVYKNESERNKIRYIINGKPKNYDVIILGSSRANNHFVTELFEKQGLKAFNFGISGCTLNESALMLQLFFEKGNSAKKIITEIDLNIANENISEGTRSLFMPYLKSEKSISNYYKKLPNYYRLINFPFYRYIVDEPKIGIREMFFSLIKKKSTFLNKGGFEGLIEKGVNMNFDLSKISPKKNSSYEKIKYLCYLHNSKLISVSTPICNNTKGINYFENICIIYPEVNNFENIVKDDKYFATCGHMNVDGAYIYTEFIINKFFKNEKR